MAEVDLELQDTIQIQNITEKLLTVINDDRGHIEQLSSLIFMPENSPFFKPRVVSIGPLHAPRYDPTKPTLVGGLMRCVGSPEEEILKSCMSKVYPLRIKAKGCYESSEIPTYVSDEVFIGIMVMDACFILAFVIFCISEDLDKSYRGYMLPDHAILFDLVLMGNQIPFFILNEIYQCTVSKFRPNTTLLEFLRPILNLFNIFDVDITTDNVCIDNVGHILGLLYECYKPHCTIRSGFLTSQIRSAVTLDRSGVSFKPTQNPEWLMGMDLKLNRFPCFSWCWNKTTLKMPVLYVHDFTELVLRNLIAYEHHSRQTNKYVTSYAYSMDMLVNTKEDVAILVDSRVLLNYMGSDQEAADMINSICKEVAREHFFYCEEWNKLDEYCKSYWPKNIAWLKSTYFSSPWNIIALIAGIILFALTVVQTIFSIKST